jgi:hypothetical protein
MTDLDGAVAVNCTACGIWLNSPDQYEYHVIGKNHKNRMRRGPAMEVVAVATVKIMIPEGTALILEQVAIGNDCRLCKIVLRALYARIVARL